MVAYVRIRDVSGSEPASATRAPGGSDASRLYERDEAMATLEAAIADARRGEGRAVFFVGEAGQGKTTLLGLASKHDGDVMALRTARGNAMESDLPFAFMEQALDLFTTPPSDETSGDAEDGAPQEVGAEAEPILSLIHI